MPHFTLRTLVTIVFAAIYFASSASFGKDEKPAKQTSAPPATSLPFETKTRSDNAAPSTESEQITAVKRLSAEVKELRAQLNLRIVPVGTIEAYAGTKEPAGWRICNGDSLDATKLENAALFQALGYTWGGSGKQFSLPDLRGRFLRGVDLGARRDPDDKRSVGSIQDVATATPKNPFQIGTAGAHHHGSGYTVKVDGHDTVHESTDDSPDEINLRAPASSLQDAGNHTHTLTGGDIETRPINAAVLWIIKVIP